MKRSVRLFACLLLLAILAPCVLTACKSGGTTPTDTTGARQTEYTEGTEEPGTDSEPSTLTIYPEFDERIQRDYLYRITVTQGEKSATIPVYNHAEASRTTRNPLDTTADEYRRFSTFAFDPVGGGVRVDIQVGCDFESYSVIPSAKAFRNEFYRGVISVYLDKPDYFMIRLDGKDSTLLAVLADEPETEIPTPSVNTIIVDGWQEVEGGTLELKKKGTTLYIKPGAVLNARVKVTADDCRVIGRGAILDPYSDIYGYDEKDSDLSSYTLLYVLNADNVQIDGVHLLNARCYNLVIQGIWDRSYADNARVTNLKILSTQMSSDGMMFNYYIRDAYAEHCFVYCGDNALNYEDEAHYKDILVGTTCNAIFPQTDIRNSSLEDIYVFRADDNIIDAEYDGSGGRTLIKNSTITNLYAQDVTYTNHFLYIENRQNAVVSEDGGFIIKNVYLPALDGMRKTFYQNIVQGNYQVQLTNLSIGGKIVDKINLTHSGGKYTGYVFPGENWGWIGYGDSHSFTYERTSDFTAGVKTHKATVNYKNDLNVLIGSYAVYFTQPVIREGETILLPLEQIKSELRTDKEGTIVERDGIRYVAADSLVSAGMAKEVRTDGNRLILAPNPNSGNLLLPDSGLLSQFTEMRASHMMVTAKKVGSTTEFHVTGDRGNKSDVIGLHCLINEAVKKYGTGTYRVTFRAKSDRAGTLRAAVGYGPESTTHKAQDYQMAMSYQTFTLEFNISQLIMNQAQIRLTFTGAWADVYEFDLRDVVLTKIN